MFAVIKTGGKQYRVAENDVIKVEKLEGSAGDQVAFEEVLMLGGDEPSFGAPLVDGATVVGEVVDQSRSRKIIVFKKKRRQKYRRTAGHRQHLTDVKITGILTGGEKPRAKAAAKPKADEAPKKAEAKPAAQKEAAPKTDSAPKAEAKADAKTESGPLFTAPKGDADDLKKISGVGPVLEKKLNALGITQYAQIAAFTAEDIERVDDELNFKGRIEREDWISQAKDLAKG